MHMQMHIHVNRHIFSLPRKRRNGETATERAVITEFLQHLEEDDAKEDSGDDAAWPDGPPDVVSAAGSDVEDVDVEYDEYGDGVYGGDGGRDDMGGDDDVVKDIAADIAVNWPFRSDHGDRIRAVKLAWHAQCELLAAALNDVGTPRPQHLDEADNNQSHNNNNDNHIIPIKIIIITIIIGICISAHLARELGDRRR